MKSILVPMLLLGIALSAKGPGIFKRPNPEPTPLQSVDAGFAASTGGAQVSQAEAERMIQDRENRLNPTSRRRDFSKDPGSVQGWTFSRKSIMAMLAAMKDQSDNAPIYIVMGHTENLDAGGKPILGTWHETLILFETRPFSSSFTATDYILQHPVPWP